MNRCWLSENVVASVFLGLLLFLVGFQPASALGLDQDSQQVLASVEDYVHGIDPRGSVYDIDPKTGRLTSNRLIGTISGVSFCSPLVLAHTNFIREDGAEVTGNFILESADGRLKVTYLSFGNDNSLQRIETPACRFWSGGASNLRLITFQN